MSIRTQGRQYEELYNSKYSYLELYQNGWHTRDRRRADCRMQTYSRVGVVWKDAGEVLRGKLFPKVSWIGRNA
jgi:hypothetical protein